MNIRSIKEKFDSKDGSLFGEKNINESLAMLFHENSKLTDYIIRNQVKKYKSFMNPYIVERSSQPFKCYPDKRSIDLTPYVNIERKSADLFNALINRRSCRNFDRNYAISEFELATLLHYSYGVVYKEPISTLNDQGHIGYRPVPSGGALYPLEIYVIVINGHMPRGLYHYRPDLNILEILKQEQEIDYLNQIIQAEPYIDMKSSSCIILTTGMIERCIIKYGERGYRFLLMEAGLVAQTISLLSTSVNLGSCLVGGYNDDLLNRYLEIDGVFETVNNIIVVGKHEAN